MKLKNSDWIWPALTLLQACASPSPLAPAPRAPQAEARVTAPVAIEHMPAAIPPQQPPPSDTKPLDSTQPPPFDGERKVIVEPVRGLTKIDRTIAPEDLWQRIRHGFAMPNLDNALVRRKTAEYAARPEHLQRMFDRMRLYLFHIVDEIEKRGLPTELALLPMVESAFNPLAYSRARASGLWQFIPGTGRRYELTQNWWYDARRDIVASTTAALDYLTDIYEMHGEWHLALASYNWGEHAVKRAIAKNRKAHKSTDYSSLKMPRETRDYVPKLQALKNIISDPRRFGIDLDPIPNQPYFAVIDRASDIDVQLAAKLAEMPVDEFVALNPGFKRPFIRSAMAPRIVLPADKIDLFNDNLAKHGERALVSWQVYHPKRGEKLGSLAKRFGLSVAELKRVNGIPLRSWRVPRVLVVPMHAPPIPVQAAIRAVHVVKRGDTLSSIAAHYRVPPAQLKRWNKVGRFLQIGQRIHVSEPIR